MAVRPMLRRFAGVVAITSVVLAAAPFVGTAAALDDPVVSPARSGTAGPRPVVSALYDAALNTALSKITVTSGGDTPAAVAGTVGFADGDARITFTPSADLTEDAAPYTVVVAAVPAAPGEIPPDDEQWTFQVDATPPAAASALAIAPNPSRGPVTVTGKTDPNATVAVSVANPAAPATTAVGEGVANGAGDFSVGGIAISGLADGTLRATVTPRDAYGNAAAPTTVDGVKDTVAPARVTTVPANGAAAKPRNTVSVTFDEPLAAQDSSIAVKNGVGSTLAGTTALSGDGRTMTFTAASQMTEATSPLAIFATATDLAGNTVTTPSAFEIDSTPPAAPSLALSDPVNIASAGTATASGVAEPGATVSVRIDDATPGDAVTASGPAHATTGAYSVPLGVSGLADGTLTAVAWATDPAGNDGAASGEATTRKDTVAPAAPSVDMTTPIPAAATATVSGVTAPGLAVAISVDDADDKTAPVTKATTADATTGAYSETLDVATLADGTITASVVATDGAANPSPAGTDTAVLDKGVPDRPTMNVPTVNAANAAAVPASGGAEPGTTVTVTLSDGTAPALSKSATVGDDGVYGVTFDARDLADGALTATAVAKDGAGNASAPRTLPVTKDTAAPGAPAVVLPEYVNAATDGALSVTGTAEPGSAVDVTISDADPETAHVLRSTVAAPDGAWSVVADVTGLADQTLTASATATDPAGNASTAGTDTAAKDTVAPAAPAVTLTGPIDQNNAATAAVSGTAAGVTVAVAVNDTAAATAPVTGSGPVTEGAYSVPVDVTGLADGPLTATATTTDAAGNTSATGTSAASAKDTTTLDLVSSSPAHQARVRPPATITMTLNEPVSTGQTSMTLTDKTGSLLSGAVTFANGDRTVVFTPVDTLSDAGSVYTAHLSARDADGTDSLAAGATFVVDTLPPDKPVVDISVVNAANAGAHEIDGLAEAGSSVTVVVTDKDGKAAPAMTVPANGPNGGFVATLDLDELADGPVTATAVATDAAGNASEPGTDAHVKDTVAPAAPVVSTSAVIDRATRTAAPFSGTGAEPASTVVLTVDDADDATPAATTSDMAGENGEWAATAYVSGLRDGTLTVTAVAVDAAGNKGPAATGSATKDVTRAFTVAVSGTPVSGAAQSFSVSAHQTRSTGSPIDATYTGTPVLTSPDGHFTAGTCAAAVGGVAQCSGTVFGDLGPQSLSAAEGTGEDAVTGSRDVVVQPTGLTYVVAPPATAPPNHTVKFTVAPTAGVPGASIAGYAATRKIEVTGGSVPATGSTLACAAAVCEVGVTFPTRGPKTVRVVDNGTPSLATPTATVTVPYATTLSLLRSATAVASGGSVTLSGRLRNAADLSGVGGRTVVVYRRVAPGTEMRPYASAVTAADGTWSKRLTVLKNTAYEVRFAGDAAHLSTVSPVRTVTASYVVSSAWSLTGRTVKATGKVSPNAAGRTVYLQYRKGDGTWANTLAKATIASTGGYTLTRTLPPGQYALRVAILASPTNDAGTSATFTRTIR